MRIAGCVQKNGHSPAGQVSVKFVVSALWKIFRIVVAANSFSYVLTSAITRKLSDVNCEYMYAFNSCAGGYVGLTRFTLLI